jgi:hypothetical protein
MVIEKCHCVLGSSPQWLLAQPSYLGRPIPASRHVAKAGERCFPDRIRLTGDETSEGEGFMTLLVPWGNVLGELDNGKLTEEGSQWRRAQAERKIRRRCG